MHTSFEHKPVLRDDVQRFLGLEMGDVVVDATLGLGGHALDILKKIGKEGRLYAFEHDERNLRLAQQKLAAYKSQITYFHDNFRYLKTRNIGSCESCKDGVSNESLSAEPADAVLFDLGLSSPHVDDPERGFSFLKDGPLDMRFDLRNPKTAAIVLNTYPEGDLAKIFFKYGEERMSRKIAQKICERRSIKPFSGTLELATFIEGVIPKKKIGRHPATQIFQALRIEVNDELESLKEGLEGAFECLKPDGRMVVISYHSLEDRIVKHFFRTLEHPLEENPQKALYRTHAEPLAEKLTKKPIIPGEKELEQNPRSRSAKLRAYKKI